MKKVLALGVLSVVAVAVLVNAQGNSNQRRALGAVLSGYHEVPPVSTAADGTVQLRISNDGAMITYTLEYDDLSSTASAAHIHFGTPGLNGGVSAFLCGGGGKPACPATGGTVTGTIIAADVIGPTGQGIAAGELSELLDAIRAGATYANVHSSNFPGGEIRGPIHPGFGRGHN